MRRVLWQSLILITLCVQAFNLSATSNQKEKQSQADQQIKLRALQVIKNASKLIMDSSYPEQNRLQIYLSHDQGAVFILKQIIVQLDGADKTTFNYDEKQQTALLRGGANRVYIGSATEGVHEVVAVLSGADRQGNIIKKAQTWLFDKKSGEVIARIKVSSNIVTRRPDISFAIIKGSQ
ncbi:MAG: hypothetical protein OEY36_09070 [Gammaproteobacteria bacterium]|nr:hypothetical protein [Gammaproteobacteria bacterium]